MPLLSRSPFDDASGLCNHLYPTADAVYDIGSPTRRIRNIYFVGFVPPGWTFSLGTPPSSPLLTYDIVNQDDVAQILASNDTGGINLAGGSNGLETTGGAIQCFGNNSFDTGAVEIVCGAVNGSAVRVYLMDPSSVFVINDSGDNPQFSVDLSKVDSFLPLDMNTHLIHNVVNPVAPQDAATKDYVDNPPSDKRMKEVIEEIAPSDALQKVMSAVPLRYKFLPQFNISDKVRAGFLAQDIQTLFPEAVGVGDSDDTKMPGNEGFELWTVQPDYIIPYLVAAIKELKGRNDLLETRLKALEEL